MDRAALRSLLAAHRYADLTRYFEQLQSDFEQDPRKEYWIADAAAAFDSGDDEWLALLNAWVDASPQSFSPYLARGTYRTSLGYLRRGTRWAADTHEGDFAAMADAHKKALVDLEHALSIRPRAVAALEQELRVHMAATDDVELHRVATKAEAVCPACMLPRVRMMRALQPRWGGTYEAMTAYAKTAPVAKNPLLRVLPAYVDLDRALSLRHDGKLDEALAANERACALGEYWQSLLERALTFEAKKDLVHAQRDLARANELRPDEPDVLFPLARIAYENQRWDAAGQALISGLRIDPTSAEGRRLLKGVAQGLVYEAGQQFKAGHKEETLRLVELAIGLDPQNSQAHGIKKYVLVGPGSGADDIDKLNTAAAAAPNDFRAHQALDYALAKQRRFDEVIAMWTRYLAANPRDGKAYLERGGAFFQLGKRDEARADAKAACELGISEGCAHAK